MSKLKVLLTIAIFTIVLVGCLIYLTNHKDSTRIKMDKTSLRLKWINQSQFAGYYMANKNNHYKEASLDVSIEPAGPNISPIQLVTSGVNEFGVTGADQILEARSKGVPIVAIAVFYRENPEALVSLKEKNIINPKDLENKKIAVIYGNDENAYRLFLDKEGVDLTKIKEISAIPGVSQLLTGDVDAKMAYEMNDPVLLKLEGREVNVIRFRDSNIKFYADTLFTTEKMIQEHPEKVEKFVNASIAGWNDAIRNPVEATKEVIRVNPSLKYEHQLGYLKGSIPLITQSGKIGLSDKKVWESMLGILVDKGIAKDNLDINAVFTNRFIK